MMAARLGSAKNRRAFFEKFWWDRDWGLNDWLNLVGWPDAPQNRSRQPGKLALQDPPSRFPEAVADWRRARDVFRQALEHCHRLRTYLEELGEARKQLGQVEAQLPAAKEQLDVAERDLASAKRAANRARDEHAEYTGQETTEMGKLTALSSVKPFFLAKLFRTSAWRTHESGIRAQVGRLEQVQDAARGTKGRLAAAMVEKERCSANREATLRAFEGLREDAARLSSQLEQGEGALGDAVPGPGFWALPDDELQRAAP